MGGNMKLNKKEVFFFLGIFLLLLKSWLNASAFFSEVESLESILILFSYISLFINVIINKPTYKEIRNIFSSYNICNANIYSFYLHCMFNFSHSFNIHEGN